MASTDPSRDPGRGPVLDVVERVSEMLFGLYMALTFVGALSVADAGRLEVRDMLAAAIGCNLAWGLADAVMYLVRTVTARGRWLTLARDVRAAADAREGRRLIEASLARATAPLFSEEALEGVRVRILGLGDLPARPRLERDDLVAALGVFLIVVAATFPVVVPFVLFDDLGTAKLASRLVALAMLFLGGYALGRHAGYGGLRTGLIMTAVGVVLVAAIMALGG